MTLKFKDNELLVFRSFFWDSLRLPMYRMIVKVLKNFEICMHQLTPNAIVRLGVFIWIMQSQRVHTEADAFCRVQELHY